MTRLVQPATMHALRVGGRAVLEAADRRELLAKSLGGDPLELEIDATTYIQRDTSNRNNIRFKKSALGRLAKSFAGCPFQRDHAQGVMDRGGTILLSELATVTEKKIEYPSILQTIAAVKPWAVQGILDGTIDRFSIAWQPTGPIECSECGKPFDSMGGWSWPSCDHWPGDKIVDEDDNVTGEVDAVYTAAEGTEVSAVSVPAVVGTQIEDQRAVMSALANGGTAPRGEIVMKHLSKLAVAIGLSIDGMTEEGALDSLLKEFLHVKDGAEDAGIKLAAEIAARAAVEKDRDAARAELATLAADALSAGVEAEVERGIREGRFAMARDAQGARVETPIERAVRHAGKAGLAAAKAYVDGFPARAIAPTGLRSADPDPARAHSGAGGAGNVEGAASLLSPAELDICRQTNTKPEDFLSTKRKREAERAERAA